MRSANARMGVRLRPRRVASGCSRRIVAAAVGRCAIIVAIVVAITIVAIIVVVIVANAIVVVISLASPLQRALDDMRACEAIDLVKLRHHRLFAVQVFELRQKRADVALQRRRVHAVEGGAV